jgi:hypothetical protein
MPESLNTEEDVRAQVVLPWLAGHGFGLGDIFLDHSFNILAGRNTLRVGNNQQTKRGKITVFADVLVRDRNKRNLFIIKVKAPGESLTDEARDQALCYARLLKEGGMAPFALVTNGAETRCYDTFTGRARCHRHRPRRRLRHAGGLPPRARRRRSRRPQPRDGLQMPDDWPRAGEGAAE